MCKAMARATWFKCVSTTCVCMQAHEKEKKSNNEWLQSFLTSVIQILTAAQGG